MDQLIDLFGRVVGDVRISVTDRCNFRCSYCIPEDYDEWLPRSEILSFEEIARIVGVLQRFGVKTVRLTGGEPLMRKHLHRLISMLDGVDISLTTNGVFLPQQAQELAEAGLRRVNVSLDTLRADRFLELTKRDQIQQVLDGISAAQAAGLKPVKINTVVMSGRNDDELVDLVTFGREHDCEVRFIEFMPLDGGHNWSKASVFGKAQICEAIGAVYPFEAVAGDGREPATRFRFTDGRGGFGVIASVTEPFCSRCDRIRVTADGMLRTCLFALDEYDLKAMLRGGGSDNDLAEFFRAVVMTKGPGHKIGSRDFVQPSRPMIAIGG